MCGTTHLLNAFSPWLYSPWIHALILSITALISQITATTCFKLIPLALAMASPLQLKNEIRIRKRAEKKLHTMYQRALIISQMTKEIRRSLKMQDVSNATTIQLAIAFHASSCGLYLLGLPEERDGDKLSHRVRCASRYSLREGQLDEDSSILNAELPPLYLEEELINSEKAVALDFVVLKKLDYLGVETGSDLIPFLLPT